MNIKNWILKLFFLSLLMITILGCIPTFADDEDDIESTLNEINKTIETSGEISAPLNLNCRSCVVIDRKSQTIMYSKNETSKVKMASTTKIMTATVIIEKCDLNQTVEVSKKAAGTIGSRVGLKTGDKITIRDLLYGLMLCSGNDAAVALAETAGGSIEGFSELMNNKAKELGLTNTNFESPHGLDSDKHYTTAYELAILTNYALSNPTFAQIVGTKNYTITLNGYPKELSNTNELLGNLNGVYGVKTGYTSGANRCLVTACKRGDMDIVCVVLGCDTKKFRTSDSVKLIEYSFKNFEYVNLDEILNNSFLKWKEKNQDYFSVYKGAHSNLEIQHEKLPNAMIPILKKDISSIKVDIQVENLFDAPVFPNTIIGGLTVSSNSGFISHCNIYTTNEITKKSTFNYFIDLLKLLPLENETFTS